VDLGIDQFTNAMDIGFLTAAVTTYSCMLLFTVYSNKNLLLEVFQALLIEPAACLHFTDG